MASDLTSAIWKAVHEALVGAQSEAVYNGDAPPGTSLPYTVIDSVQAVPDEQIERKRDIATVFITCWTRGPSKALQLLDNVRTSLDHAVLSLDTGRMTRAYVTNRSTSPDIDGQTHQGQATVRVIATR